MWRGRLIGASTAAAATVLAAAVWAATPETARDARKAEGPDSTNAALLLNAARGTRSAICELAVQAIHSRYGSWSTRRYTPDGDSETRALATWASRPIDGADAIPVLRAGLSDPDPCVRRLAARLLGRVRDRRAVETLVAALGSGDDETRRMAAIGLGYADVDAAVDPLVETLAASAATVRAASAWALGEIEDTKAVPALARALDRDPDAAVRVQAAVALGAMW